MVGSHLTPLLGNSGVRSPRLRILFFAFLPDDQKRSFNSCGACSQPPSGMDPSQMMAPAAGRRQGSGSVRATDAVAVVGFQLS